MFSGLVGCMGEIRALSPQGRDLRMTVNANFAAAGFAHFQIKKGDSIAVNGVCLTAESASLSGAECQFTAFASQETLANSNLGAIKNGSRVNLELALALGDRLGGHLVSGHVDGLAQVIKVQASGQSRQVSFSCAKAFDPFIVPKGSVCLDGISLTVNDCAPGFLQVNIIPQTWEATTAANWFAGYQANLETDMLGKFVAKMLRVYTAFPAGSLAGSPSGSLAYSPSTSSSTEQLGQTMEKEFFLKNGF